jgi:GNAT superfamily N-acetyltransferase
VANIEISAADLSADRAELVDLLFKYSTVRSNTQRYQWFYEGNPDGRAEVLLARESRTGAIIGSGAVIPRKLYAGGVLSPAAVMADFWIHPEHRSLGPAVRLQRACMERAAAMGGAFFDLPQGNMSAVYKRLGVLGGSQLASFSKPLRAWPFVETIVRPKALARALSVLGDCLLAAADRGRLGWGKGCVVERHNGELGPEFSQLTSRAAEQPWISVARSADYLDWRYRRHYYLQYGIFTARDSRGQLLGYAVTVSSGVYAEVVDLFPVDRPRLVLELLCGMSRLLREQGDAALAISCLPTEALAGSLRNAGLRDRQRRPLVVHEFAGARHGGAPWLLTYGDIDY